MAGILPEEVPDEGLRKLLVASILHEKVLDFAAHPSYVKDSVRPFHSFKIDGDHPEAFSEQDVGGSHVAVDKNLLVRPDKILRVPQVFESA